MLRDPRPELSTAELVRIRNSVTAIGRLSDSLVRLGPLRLGVDGLLTWIPGVGEIYSAVAAAFILVQGLRARVPAHILLLCAALMASRTSVAALPLLGPVAADLFTAHRWSARLVAGAIDARLPVAARAAGGASWLSDLLRPGRTATA